MFPYCWYVGIVFLPSLFNALMDISENAGYVVSVGMKLAYLEDPGFQSHQGNYLL
jgi:hypothetical protein